MNRIMFRKHTYRNRRCHHHNYQYYRPVVVLVLVVLDWPDAIVFYVSLCSQLFDQNPRNQQHG